LSGDEVNKQKDLIKSTSKPYLTQGFSKEGFP